MALSQPTTKTLTELLDCATTWSCEARTIGNIKVSEIVSSLTEVLYASDDEFNDKLFPHIILEGTIRGGFKAYGPFRDYDAAYAWAEENLDDMERDLNVWWVMPIESPQAYVAELQSILNKALEEGKKDEQNQQA